MKTRNTPLLGAHRRDARGQVLVLFALMLVVLLLVSALAVDYGGWLVTKRNYQNVTDAASLAGAQQLTRPSLSASKQQLAREAAWQSIKTALNFTGLDPVAQAMTSSSATGYYTENNYKVWVASPPSDAGSAYVGHVSGPGVIYVRIDHPALDFLSRIANTNRNVAAWSTAGRFPANFAVIGMCSTVITASCLAGDSNIKLDGTNTNLIVATGDVGTNRWVRAGGTSSGVALGVDSNAYMELFNDCWNAGGNQCNLFGWTGTAVNTSDVRNAIPLGAPIQDPSYAPPATGSTATPDQCRGTVSAQLASAHVVDGPNLNQSQISDLPVKLASAIQPQVPGRIVDAAVKVSGTVTSGGVGVYAGVTVDLVDATTNLVYKTTTTSAGGAYSFNGVNNSPPNYYLRVTDSTATQEYATTTTVSASYTSNSTVNVSVSKNPLVTGTVQSGATLINGATVTVTASGNNYTAITNASGVYTRYIPTYGAFVSYNVTAAATGYVTGGPTLVPIPTAVDQSYTVNFNLTVAPGSVTGTITDAVTTLPVVGVTVTLSSGESATTNTSGVYTIASTTQGSKTITLSGSSMTGYAYATPVSGSTLNVTGAMTQNFTLWPKGCSDSGNLGNWSCSYPSGNNCPAPTNTNAANVNCTFTQANAIRPGTYNNITLPNGTCAWLDPSGGGGVTGLASGQSGGVYHIHGTLSIGNGSYLFGDGVTLVFDQGASITVGNGGGWVLNYGTEHNTPSDRTSSCSNYSTAFSWADAQTTNFYPCFRTVSSTTCATSATPTNGTDCADRAYAAWTTKGHLLWSGTTSPTYSDSTVSKGSELGITFYFYCPTNNAQCGLGNNSRMKISTASMGYLFNGVLYGPGDDIQLGGGKDGQTAAGQIVGWTIEYHGGTAIQQNWYGNDQDGPPFLIEPVIGE